jgi:hypothetical protein
MSCNNVILIARSHSRGWVVLGPSGGCRRQVEPGVGGRPACSLSGKGHAQGKGGTPGVRAPATPRSLPTISKEEVHKASAHIDTQVHQRSTRVSGVLLARANRALLCEREALNDASRALFVAADVTPRSTRSVPESRGHRQLAKALHTTEYYMTSETAASAALPDGNPALSVVATRDSFFAALPPAAGAAVDGTSNKIAGHAPSRPAAAAPREAKRDLAARKLELLVSISLPQERKRLCSSGGDGGGECCPSCVRAESSDSGDRTPVTGHPSTAKSRATASWSRRHERLRRSRRLVHRPC